MVGRIHAGGASFRGVVAYCLADERDREKEERDRENGKREPVTIVRPQRVSERVAWAETRNLVTNDPRKAARQMAATVQYAPEVKKLAGIGAGGRKLEKPVLHYSLSWAEGEKPEHHEMSRAVDESLKELGVEDRQAVVIAHRDGKTPHVHVVANRVSAEDGRAASLDKSRLKLSRWAERWEREHGRLRCPRRAEHNRRRDRGEWVVDRQQVADARHRRTRSTIGRERVEVGERHHRHERWRDVVDAAQRRLHERRVWKWVQETAEPVRGDMERAHRAEWADLLGRQDDDPGGNEAQHRRERAELGRRQGREARQVAEGMEDAYRDGLERQPPGWEDSPELEAEIEKLGGMDRYDWASFNRHQFEARMAREMGRPPPGVGPDRGWDIER